MQLRPYQENCKTGCFNLWADGKRSLLGVLPTRMGKTIVFASIIKKFFPKRTMVIAHRQELVFQARDKIKRVTGLTVDIEMGELKSTQSANLFHPRASVIVSTVQTHVAGGDGSGRLGKFDPMDFGLLIIDEAHHATSSSYRKIIDYYTTNPNLKVLGVTATPDRADEEALGQIFEEVAFDYEILDAIHDGWLVPVFQQVESIEGLDYSHVRTTAGDLNQTDLNAVMTQEKPLQGIAGATIDIIGDRRGIGFASSVEHARILSNIFNRHHTGMSAFVCAGTDKDERALVAKQFKNGDLQWIWNCGIYTEGYDEAGIQVVSMARPTKSRALYAQMGGRAMGPDDSIAHALNDLPSAILRRAIIKRSCKPSCLLIDFAGNSGRHKLVSAPDILGGKISEEAVAATTDFVRRSGGPVNIARNLDEEEEKAEAAKKRKLEEEAKKTRLVAKVKHKGQMVDPFDILKVRPAKPRGWDEGKILSDKQRGILKSAGFDPDAMDYARGSQLVHIIMERRTNGKCTFGQAKVLKRFNFPTDMSFFSASATIDAIARNGWNKPANFIVPTEPAKETQQSHTTIDSDDVPF